MFPRRLATPVSIAQPSLESLYASHAPQVMRWATRLMGDSQDAGDITQEVFLIVQRRLHSFTARDGALETWLFRITENVVRNRRRRAQRREQPVDTVHESTAPGRLPDEELDARRAARVVADVLALMSPTDRELLVLFELEEHTGAQVAEMLGLSSAVIWVRLHRARTRFAEKLKEHRPEESR